MKEPILLDAHGRHAQAVQFTRDGKLLVSVGQDACVRLWSVPGFRADAVFEGHKKSVNTISFSPEETLLATGSSDGTVRVWSFPEGKCLHVLEKQVSGTFSPDRETLATISAQGKVILWDRKTGREIKTLPVRDARIFSLAFSPDGRTLLVAGTGPIHCLRLPEGTEEDSLPGHQTAVACLCVSPNGKHLASTGFEGTLRLWSTRDWSEALRVELRAAGTLQIAFTPDSEAVSVSSDQLIRTFSVEDGAEVERHDLPVKGVYGVAWSPDGRFLANAAADGKVRVWTRE